MSRPRFAKKLDSTHAGIKEYLEKNGVEVVDCSSAGGVPDLLCRHPNGMVGWVEAKRPKYPYFTYKQLEWISRTRFAVRIVDNGEDALHFVKTHEGMLTQDQKDRLAIYLQNYRFHKSHLHTANDVLEAMG